MAVNLVVASGVVRSPVLRYDDRGKPELRLTIDQESGGYHLYLPCLALGATAERLASELDDGDAILITGGTLTYRKRATKLGEQSRLELLVWTVQRLSGVEAGGGSVSPKAPRRSSRLKAIARRPFRKRGARGVRDGNPRRRTQIRRRTRRACSGLKRCYPAGAAAGGADDVAGARAVVSVVLTVATNGNIRGGIMARLTREFVTVERARQWINTYDPNYLSNQVAEATARELRRGKKRQWWNAIIVDEKTDICHDGLTKLLEITKAEQGAMCWIARADDFHFSAASLEHTPQGPVVLTREMDTVRSDPLTLPYTIIPQEDLPEHLRDKQS
jgi:hypothetical protein